MTTNATIDKTNQTGQSHSQVHPEADRHAPQPHVINLNIDQDAFVPLQDERMRETFIPVTSYALMDRLTRPEAWGAADASDAKRFFRYLACWRQQQYQTRVTNLDHAYEPFSPDSDLLMTRQFTEGERAAMQSRVVKGMCEILAQANYTRINRSEIELILTSDSHYGLDFHVDLQAFEELEIYYRGASQQKDQRRTLRNFFRKEEFEVPIFQRLFILFKLKTEEQCIEEYMRTRNITRKKAEKAIRAFSKHIPDGVSREQIYMKLFKNMPRTDVEMIFPNTRVKFRLFDKIKLGVTGSGAVGMGLYGTLSKIFAGGTAILASPIAIAGMLFAIGGVLFRQIMGCFNTRQRYMVVMAQNLYFHSMADNRGVIVSLAERAAEEDVKEEILLYSVLAKETLHRKDLKAADRAIEQYLEDAFGVSVDFDLEDALGRLIADGIVNEDDDGTLHALAPAQAAGHIDSLWDIFLDRLPDSSEFEGIEFEGQAGGALSGPQSQPKEVHIEKDATNHAIG